MHIIKLTVTKRNDATVDSEGQAFGVDDIISPIRYNSDDSVSYFTFNDKSAKIAVPAPVLPINYEVSEDLDDIEILNDELLKLTVVRRRNVVIDSEVIVFVTSKISGAIKPYGSNTVFMYIEGGDPQPVEYEVTESVDDIMAEIDVTPGTGTVTRVMVDNFSPLFTATMGTATTQPVIHFFSPTQGVNKFYAGPTSGTGTTASFRVIDVLDLPATAKNLVSPQGANLVLAGPTGPTSPSGYPSFRLLVGNDLPLQTITGPSSSPTAGTNVALKITINGQDYFIQARQ